MAWAPKTKIRVAKIKFDKYKFKIEILGEDFDYIVFDIAFESWSKLLRAGILGSDTLFKIKKKRGHFSGRARSIKYELPKSVKKLVTVSLGFVPCS